MPGEVFKEEGKLEECRLEAPQITQIVKKLRKANIPIREDILSEEELIKSLLLFKKNGR